jgi:hypothetical protein
MFHFMLPISVIPFREVCKIFYERFSTEYAKQLFYGTSCIIPGQFVASSVLLREIKLLSIGVT